MEETDSVDEWRRRLNALDLTEAERHRATAGLRDAEALRLRRGGAGAGTVGTP